MTAVVYKPSRRRISFSFLLWGSDTLTTDHIHIVMKSKLPRSVCRSTDEKAPIADILAVLYVETDKLIKPDKSNSLVSNTAMWLETAHFV